MDHLASDDVFRLRAQAELINGHCEFAKQVDDSGVHLHNFPYDAAEYLKYEA